MNNEINLEEIIKEYATREHYNFTDREIKIIKTFAEEHKLNSHALSDLVSTMVTIKRGEIHREDVLNLAIENIKKYAPKAKIEIEYVNKDIFVSVTGIPINEESLSFISILEKNIVLRYGEFNIHIILEE